MMVWRYKALYSIGLFFLLAMIVNRFYCSVLVASSFEVMTKDVYIVTVKMNDNERIEWSYLDSDVAPFVLDGVTMVPLRALAEYFNYTVAFSEVSKYIHVSDSLGTNRLVFAIDSSRVIKNNEEEFYLQNLIVHENRTFIPIHYVSELFGLTVYCQVNPRNESTGVWISSVGVLSDEDVFPDQNNYVETSDGFNLTYYLLDNGITSRGIHLYDNVEEIYLKYGIPHIKQYNDDNELEYVLYTTLRHPDKGDGVFLVFYIVDDIVSNIQIVYGV